MPPTNPAMWRLTTLGGLAIERVSPAGVSETAEVASLAGGAQRRPLALLAVLAASGDQGVSRDTVLLYFWPDSDVERARNALRQTLFRLRRDLGPSDPVIGTTELRLDPRVITSDVAEFESALAAGQLERASSIYHGPFLHGVSIGSTPEFDQWVAEERAKLAHRHAAAVESLAYSAEACGKHDTAIARWRTLATRDPTNARVAVDLMTALARSGDRDGALQYYRLHEVLLQEELDIEPNDTVVALVDRLRAEAHLGSSVAAPSSAKGSDATNARVEASPSAQPNRGVGWASPPRVLAVAVALAALAIVAGLWSRSLESNPAPSVSRDIVAVLPFSTRGDAADTMVGSAVSDLLGTGLDGAGALRIADRRALQQGADSLGGVTDDLAAAQELAERHGAGVFVLGDVTSSGERLTVTATAYRSGSPPVRIGEIVATGQRDDLRSLADDLGRQLVVTIHSAPAERLIRAAALTTGSLPALRAFLDGEHHFQRAEFGPAVEAFRRATTEDTTFALGFYRLSVAADWASHPHFPTSALNRAMELVGTLPEHDQLLVRALAAWRGGRGAEATGLYRMVVSLYPDDAEAWYQLGEAIYHAGPGFGLSVLDARQPFERALQFRLGARESLVHLVRLAAKAKDRAAVDSLVQRVVAMDSTRDVTELRLFRALVLGQRDSAGSLLDSLANSPDEAVLSAAWRAGVFAEDFEGAAALARLLIAPSRGPDYQATGRWYVAALELAGGRWKTARATLAPGWSSSMPNGYSNGRPAAAPDLRPGSADALHAGHLGLMAAMPLLSLSPDELASLRARVSAWPEPPSYLAEWSNLWQPRFRDFVLGVLSARAGDTAAVNQHAIRLEALRSDPTLGVTARILALTLRAEVARSAGKPAEAIALLESAPAEGGMASVLGSRAYDRFLRAELLRELGRHDEAFRWYATQGQTIVPELIYLAPAELRQAQIHERRGDRARAAGHYRRFIELWHDADAELQPVVADARRRLNRLGTDARTPGR
jgi:DNA-binding SARP family transcriptional activator